jgi:uncharacterized protein with HEPN domain
LADIIHAIDLIEPYVRRGRSSFEHDELLQVWMIHHLVILGEAATRLSPALREGYPEVPWTGIVGIRNVLVHGYFAIDLDEVWGIVQRQLPTLRAQIESILRELGQTGPGVAERVHPYALTI